MERVDPIPGSTLSGPWPVGQYAGALKEKLRQMARVQVFGEVVGFKIARAKVFFELRDGVGALPCSMWRRDWEALGLAALEDGVRVVAAGGPDYYPGSRTSSPGFSFAVTDVRIAGEGDLLAQLAELRRRLDAEGLFEPQKRLPRRAVPRTIGVVTGESGKARDDVLAGLRRRGWAGRIVWAFAPVQDRHAAPLITAALQDLAACEEIDVVIVARGGGSLMDLFAFCDETLCRTVSMLRVPVIASVGHHTDRTLIDDVAAVSCSTPTHAAEAAAPIHCGEARAAVAALGARLELHACRTERERERLHGLGARMRARAVQAERGRALVANSAVRLRLHGRRAVLDRARTLAALWRSPGAHLDRHRTALHQSLRELRASARRGTAARDAELGTRALVLARKSAATSVTITRGRTRGHADAGALERSAATAVTRRRQDLDRLALALAAHDPQRTLERGYALVETPAGEAVTSAAEARSLQRLTLRLHDGAVAVNTEDTE